MQNVIKSFIFHLLAISTPLILTSCSNSDSETPQPSSQNQIAILNSFSTDSNKRLEKAIYNNTLSLETTVHVKKGETVDKVIESIKKDSNNLIKTLSYSDAIRNGFNYGTDKIVNFSDISISSFVSSDLDISTEKVNDKENKLTVTVTIKKDVNKTWNIKDLNTIKFDLTVNAINSDLFKSITLFTNLDEAKKLVPTDANNGSGDVVLTGTLDGRYKLKQDDDDLQTISHKSLDELKKWLNGTTETTSSNLNADVFLDLFFDGVIDSELTNKVTSDSAKEQYAVTDVVLKKESMIPHIISNENVSAIFNVTESDSGSTINFQGRQINTKIRNVKITLSLKNGYSWTGLSETAKTKNIVLNFSIPAPVLEEITLFTEWDEENFTLNDDAFVFENKLDENYEEFSWKNKDDVLNWFKQTKNSKELSTLAEDDGTVPLNKQKFVGLFFNKILLNDDFKFIPKASGAGKETAKTNLSKSSFLPHGIGDKGVDAKVKVTDIPPKVSGYATDNTIGNQKKVEITLTPKSGYGWNLIKNTTNRTKPIKFILNMDASDATLPINALLGAVKTYNSPDKGPIQNLYWFKCDSNNNNQFDYSKAEESIQQLVSKSIFAGPSQDEKTKKASEVYANDFVKQDWTDAAGTESQKTKRLAYLKKGFDLSEEKNFNLFKELVLNQNFSNVYKEGEADKTDIYVAGASLWFSEYKQEIKDQLKQQINCDIMISTAEASEQTAKTNEEITYTVSFRLTPKNGGNWKGRDDNYPIDIDVIFNAPNLTSFVENKIDTFASQNVSKKPAITTNGSNKTIDFVGEVDKSIFTGENIPTDAATIQSYFEKKDAPSSGQKYTKAALESNKIDVDKFKQIKTNIKDSIKNGSGKDQYIIAKDNISFLYINDGKTITGQNTYFTKKTVNVKSLEAKDKDVNNKTYTLEIILTLSDKQKSGWFWGGWDEITSSDKNAETRISDIKLSLDISLK